MGSEKISLEALKPRIPCACLDPIAAESSKRTPAVLRNWKAGRSGCWILSVRVNVVPWNDALSVPSQYGEREVKGCFDVDKYRCLF